MSVEVIATGGYEEVGKNMPTKPLEKVSSKNKGFQRFSNKFYHGGQL